jgi:beta-galactosidase
MARAPREIMQFTNGWRFLQSDALGAEKPQFPDASWTSVNLPHDWSIAGPLKEDAPSRGAGGFFATGVGWYRKTFPFKHSAGTGPMPFSTELWPTPTFT